MTAWEELACENKVGRSSIAVFVIKLRFRSLKKRGIRWRMESCVRAVNRTSRSAARKIRVAAGGSPLHQRGVYAHCASNFLMVNAIEPKMPADIKYGMGTTLTAKADVTRWLTGSIPTASLAGSCSGAAA